METRGKIAPTGIYKQDAGGSIYLIASLEFGSGEGRSKDGRDVYEEDTVVYEGMRFPLSKVWSRGATTGGRQGRYSKVIYDETELTYD